MEVEVKLRLADAAAHASLAAALAAARRATHQQENYFFDGAAQELSSRRVVLRVRFYDKDAKAVITVKVGCWAGQSGTPRRAMGAGVAATPPVPAAWLQVAGLSAQQAAPAAPATQMRALLGLCRCLGPFPVAYAPWTLISRSLSTTLCSRRASRCCRTASAALQRRRRGWTRRRPARSCQTPPSC
jgi:hypothetical protein